MAKDNIEAARNPVMNARTLVDAQNEYYQNRNAPKKGRKKLKAEKQAALEAEKNRPGFMNRDYDGKDAKSVISESLGISTDESKPGLFDSFKKQVLEPSSGAAADAKKSESEKEKKGFTVEKAASSKTEKADDVSKAEEK